MEKYSFTQIEQYLDLKISISELENEIHNKFPEPNDQKECIAKCIQFLKYFDMFRDLTAMREELYRTLLNTLDIAENLSEIDDLLVKSILLRITEIFIDNSPFQDKDRLVKTLSQSLEVLAPSALIINLGLLVKPLFSNPEYLAQRENQEEVEVEKVDTSVIAKEIKSKVNSWIQAQQLDLDKQEELHKQLEELIKNWAIEAGLDINSQEFRQIMLESKEMLNLQLTALSLMMDLGDEDLSPQPLAL